MISAGSTPRRNSFTIAADCTSNTRKQVPFDEAVASNVPMALNVASVTVFEWQDILLSSA